MRDIMHSSAVMFCWLIFPSLSLNSNVLLFINLRQFKWEVFQQPAAMQMSSFWAPLQKSQRIFPLHQILSRLQEKTHRNDILIAACGKWYIDLYHIFIRSKIKTYQASIDLEEKEWELWSICELLINILMTDSFVSIGCKEYSIFIKASFGLRLFVSFLH